MPRLTPRLTENDRHLGRFITYARCSPSWRPLRLVYSSGAHEDGPGPNTLTLYLFGWIVRLLLPRLLDDYRVRHVAASWDAATVARMDRHLLRRRPQSGSAATQLPARPRPRSPDRVEPARSRRPGPPGCRELPARRRNPTGERQCLTST